ncbi:hypothetical protein DLM78_16765 [Leptospira stimsonii]|uniref:Uncharacterized protein n=1 Tax=Leptospira stimsonii TaxID=2202203 RepID=A0A8B3CPY4_9LEPT|nr:hypothetical protein DLM78_16765 [Leptospira stimsonii]
MRRAGSRSFFMPFSDSKKDKILTDLIFEKRSDCLYSDFCQRVLFRPILRINSKILAVGTLTFSHYTEQSKIHIRRMRLRL